MAQTATEPKRFHYTRKMRVAGDEVSNMAIFDVFADGREEFWEREYGSVRWFEFTPSAAERAAVLRLYAKGSVALDDIIDLDALPG